MGTWTKMPDFESAGRIVAHGKIEDLSSDFSIGKPFSVYIRPLGVTNDVDVVVSVKCIQDKEFSDAPFLLNDWSPLEISAIEANAIDINTYEVYWGAGSFVK